MRIPVLLRESDREISFADFACQRGRLQILLFSKKSETCQALT